MSPEVVTVVRGAALDGHAAAAHGAAPPSTPGRGRGHATPTLPDRPVRPGPDPDPIPHIHRRTPRDLDPDPDHEQGRGRLRFNGAGARQAFLIKEGLQGKNHIFFNCNAVSVKISHNAEQHIEHCKHYSTA